MAKCETCKFDNVCDFSGTFRNNVRECRTYEQKEQQTWGNKIRAMSDEELAEFLSHYMSCAYCDAGDREHGCKDCKTLLMQLLKSEVKE